VSSADSIIPQPAALNGDRPQSESPARYTQPQLLASVEELRNDVFGIAVHLVGVVTAIEATLDRLDQATEFVGYRVERARVRERRRNRRGQRKAVRS
jgi:hypothetical protein